jgi:hypothetical protein
MVGLLKWPILRCRGPSPKNERQQPSGVLNRQSNASSTRPQQETTIVSKTAKLDAKVVGSVPEPVFGKLFLKTRKTRNRCQQERWACIFKNGNERCPHLSRTGASRLNLPCPNLNGGFGKKKKQRPTRKDRSLIIEIIACALACHPNKTNQGPKRRRRKRKVACSFLKTTLEQGKPQGSAHCMILGMKTSTIGLHRAGFLRVQWMQKLGTKFPVLVTLVHVFVD